MDDNVNGKVCSGPKVLEQVKEACTLQEVEFQLDVLRATTLTPKCTNTVEKTCLLCAYNNTNKMCVLFMVHVLFNIYFVQELLAHSVLLLTFLFDPT